MPDDSYKGDLEGRPTPHAASMSVGVCRCGYLVGVDLLDAEGVTLAHGHLDIESALEFAALYGEAIEEAINARAALALRRLA